MKGEKEGDSRNPAVSISHLLKRIVTFEKKIQVLKCAIMAELAEWPRKKSSASTSSSWTSLPNSYVQDVHRGVKLWPAVRRRLLQARRMLLRLRQRLGRGPRLLKIAGDRHRVR